MMRSRSVVAFALSVFMAVAGQQCTAFNPPAATAAPTTTTVDNNNNRRVVVDHHHHQDRRAFLSRGVASAAASILVVAGGNVLLVPPAVASGGATAGGAYLLSAKQRYNERVIKGLKGYLALEDSLKGGSVAEAKDYFAGEEVGTWGDISTAAYLLANAFRRNSQTPPDNLPSVKAWKAFVKELDNTQKSVKKKDAASAYESFSKSKELLDSYLSLVELPPVMELK